MRICKVEGCGKRHKAWGWCIKHYDRARLDGKIPGRSKPCPVPECGDYIFSYGLCNKHSGRQRRGRSLNDFGLRLRRYKPVPRGYWQKEYGFDLTKAHAEQSYRAENFGAFLYCAWKSASGRTGRNKSRRVQLYYSGDPIMSPVEWFKHFFHDEEIRTLWRRWASSGCPLNLCPVPDHVTDNGKGYTIGNILWVTFSENALMALEKRASA